MVRFHLRLQRFEKTNEMLLNFNALSKGRYETTQQEFRKHTLLLSSMKKDLDAVFKRIRYIYIHVETHIRICCAGPGDNIS